MRTPQFKSKYDSLYQNLDYYKKEALWSTSFFLLRRILFAGVIVFCEGSLVAQVVLSDILCTLLLIFLILVKPMVDTWNNCVQIINEVVVLVCIWLMFHNSDYVGNPETRYDLAYIFLYLVATDVALNITYLIVSITSKIIVACRSYFTKRKAKRGVDLKVKDARLAKS